MARYSEKEVMLRLADIENYQLMFNVAFPNSKNPFLYDNLKKAIGIFERECLKLSRFDECLNGDLTALSNDEKKGLSTFITEGDGMSLGVHYSGWNV